MLKGNVQAGIIINDVLTELEEETQKPLWDEYKNAKANKAGILCAGKVVCGWQALEPRSRLGISCETLL